LHVKGRRPSTPCQGTKTRSQFHIIVNFTNRTVQGFGFPNGPFDNPLKIERANDMTVVFGGEEEISVPSMISGSIGRVTGDLDATWSFIDKTGKLQAHMTYALQCKPTPEHVLTSSPPRRFPPPWSD
jgi:hypothetical protein